MMFEAVIIFTFYLLTIYVTNVHKSSLNNNPLQKITSKLGNLKFLSEGFQSLFGGIVIFTRWIKTRTSYSTDSWIYTTNHKRIAVNYFNFVLVSGTAGMSLATVIRLEFAYPGVGILAGDSLQYLSIATAHGVIMVFFMIMPAIFGGFGNFLLPTQLGVHDVAFPRLNSAAFWFLPGALIMLCQLVCVDRRYQRMNAFNIRELQGILKRRFFNDLVNTTDHRQFLSQTLIGIRFKSNSNLSINPDTSIIYNFGTTLSTKSKTTTFRNIYDNASLFSKDKLYFTEFFKFYNSLTFGDILDKLSYSFNNVMVVFKEALFTPKYQSNLLNHVVYAPSNILNTMISVVGLNLNFNFADYLQFFKENSSLTGLNKTLFSSENINSTVANDENQMSELSNNIRFTRFNNPLISYDYKCGNYIGIWEQLYPALMTSYIEVARGIRKAPWFFSDQFSELLKNNFNNFNTKFTTQNNLKLADVDNWYSSHVNPTDNYTNLFYLLKKNEGFVNLRWVALNSLDQKFYKMFDSSSTQQRILANWRQLKFTREAWRCKLLAARHQNTLYRRFTGEEGLVYSIERNAKDLLPGW